MLLLKILQRLPIALRMKKHCPGSCLPLQCFSLSLPPDSSAFIPLLIIPGPGLPISSLIECSLPCSSWLSPAYSLGLSSYITFSGKLFLTILQIISSLPGSCFIVYLFFAALGTIINVGWFVIIWSTFAFPRMAGTTSASVYNVISGANIWHIINNKY